MVSRSVEDRELATRRRHNSTGQLAIVHATLPMFQSHEDPWPQQRI